MNWLQQGHITVTYITVNHVCSLEVTKGNVTSNCAKSCFVTQWPYGAINNYSSVLASFFYSVFWPPRNYTMREKVINGSKLVLICFHPQRRERKMGPGEVWDKRIYLWASAKRFLSGRSKCIYILLELKLFRSHHLNIGWCLGVIASSTVTVPLNSAKHLFQGHSSLWIGLSLTTSAQWLVGLANTRLLPLII